MWLAGPWAGEHCAEEGGRGWWVLSGLPLGPHASWQVAEPHLGLCAVSAMCSSAQWEGSLSERWVWGEVPAIRPSPVPRVGRCSMGQTLLG